MTEMASKMALEKGQLSTPSVSVSAIQMDHMLVQLMVLTLVSVSVIQMVLTLVQLMVSASVSVSVIQMVLTLVQLMVYTVAAMYGWLSAFLYSMTWRTALR